jgi:hypothetical protein
MALIRVPRPKDAYDPNRPMGSLLKAQVEHLREAESKLPLRYRDEIDTYIKAIRTEGEAARYIQKVTEAIHDAHADAERARHTREHKPASARKRVIEIAAVADVRAERKQKSTRSRSATSSKKRAARKPRKK